MTLPIMLSAPALIVGTLVVSTPLILLVIGLFFAIMLTIAHSKLKEYLGLNARPTRGPARGQLRRMRLRQLRSIRRGGGGG